MRKTVIILTTFVVLVSCNNSEKTNTTSNAPVSELISNTTKRQKLILELKKLRQTIASSDKEKIADIFEFPLTDESFSIYIDDNSFNEQFNSNGNKTTRTMFLQHYKSISESIWLDQLKNLFHNIAIDSLDHKDTLVYEAYRKTEPCFYSYQIELNKDIVTLRMNMNSNRNYESKTISEEETPENSSEICEHNFWWIFKFDGNKLHLESISGAG
ncbi:MAG: hypothetical protein K0M56_04630 [Kaistella sp.]|nr:hypothetical protein [Kaistella sp.]